MSIDRESLEIACNNYPKSKKYLQKICMAQIKRLNQVRRRKLHLHRGNNKS